MLTILYDGWSLIYAPSSPAALHLAVLLELSPPGVQPVVALPGTAPGWLSKDLQVQVEPQPGDEFSRLKWEQRILPALARKVGADLLHLSGGAAALFSPAQTVLSPAGVEWMAEPGLEPTQGGLAGRLRVSLRQGGMARLRAVFWPEDLPAPDLPAPLLRLPPDVPPAVRAEPGVNGHYADLDLPEDYVLYHGPYGRTALHRLFTAWGWAAGPVGERYPLLLLGAGPTVRDALPELLRKYGVDESVQVLPELQPPAIWSLYRGCAALFHPAPVPPWGSAVRFALAYARPVVGLENPLVSALVGPAAYLVPDEKPGQPDGRALGAALITVLVEESVSAALSDAAQKRSAGWRPESFRARLEQVYLEIKEP